MEVSIPEALGFSILGIVIVFFALTLLIMVITLIGKIAGEKKDAQREKPAGETQAAPEKASVPAAKGTYGDIQLHGVPDRTAAMIMAIVAHKTGVPISELRFISIREIK